MMCRVVDKHFGFGKLHFKCLFMIMIRSNVIKAIMMSNINPQIVNNLML